jgi:hypothetical protein
MKEMEKFMFNYKILSQKLKQSSNLEYYDYLNSCDKQHLVPLSSGILRNRVLDGNINCNGYELGDKYTQAISKGISHNNDAKEINLSNNRLSDIGATSIFDSLGRSL